MKKLQGRSKFTVIVNNSMKVEAAPNVLNIELKACLPISRKERGNQLVLEALIIDMGAVCSGCAAKLSKLSSLYKEVSSYKEVTSIVENNSQSSTAM